LEYVFIDDPVSSLDDSHLIELAVDLATLIKNSAYIEGNGLRFIITTHSPLFYNVLHNELNNDLKIQNKMGLLFGSISVANRKSIGWIKRLMALMSLPPLMIALSLIIYFCCPNSAKQ